MKQLLALLLLLTTLGASAQFDCDPAFRKALGAHYTYLPSASGVGLEVGAWGDRVPLRVSIGLTAVLPHSAAVDRKDTSATAAPWLHRLHSSAGVRLYRSDYLVQIWAGGSVVMDLDRGLFALSSLTVLWPVGYHAFSLQPQYNWATRRVEVQGGVHFLIN